VWSVLKDKGLVLCSTATSPHRTTKHVICRGDKPPKIVKLDAATGEELWSVYQPHGVSVCISSPDTSKIVCGSDKKLTMINAEDGTAAWSHTRPSAIDTCAFTKDGKHVLCSTADHSMVKLAAESGEEEWAHWRHSSDQTPGAKRASRCSVCQRALYANEACPGQLSGDHFFVIRDGNALPSSVRDGTRSGTVTLPGMARSGNRSSTMHHQDTVGSPLNGSVLDFPSSTPEFQAQLLKDPPCKIYTAPCTGNSRLPQTEIDYLDDSYSQRNRLVNATQITPYSTRGLQPPFVSGFKMI
jgi:hypothetical protein